MKTKIKTHKATKKRFKLTAKNKLMHNTQGDNAHLKTNKYRGEKTRGKGTHVLSSSGDRKRILKLLNK